jgi:glycosyltransferase involved in cell wall biosynthesis
MPQAPDLTVIIPVYNGSHFLDRCLSGLRAAVGAARETQVEIIVADDASTDASGEVARRYGAQVFRMPRQSGPGAARNAAAQQARGEVVFFVDADVVVAPDAVWRVAETFRDAPDVAAVFGSYDDDPAEQNFLSQYKNLCHHFVHQQGLSEAQTFWGGCGAVRREVFLAAGGFDRERFPRPSIEDIELGYRLRARGHRIRLDKKLQGKHLKCWKLVSWLKADIRDRAVPWSLLIFESGNLINDLNLKMTDRLSAACALLAVTLLAGGLVFPSLLAGSLAALAGLTLLNLPLFRFFAARKGFLFALAALPPQVLYYCYSSVTFALCWVWYKLYGRRKFDRKYAGARPAVGSLNSLVGAAALPDAVNDQGAAETVA